jgi:hypothetical protein
MTMDRHLATLRWGVRGVLVLGVATSVAANVLHAQPNPISQAIAAWPPVALLLTVELVSRVPTHRRALATARIAATAAIAGIAAWVSYWHMTGVAARYGERGTSPYLLPLSVDGLIIVASACLVELAGRMSPATDRGQLTDPSRTDNTTTGPEPANQDVRAPAIRPSLSGPLTRRAVLPGPSATEPPTTAGGDVTAQPVDSEPPTVSPAPRPYKPVSDGDTAMYALWSRRIADGHEPSGAELARVAGRPDDSSGIGRRAARRYRAAHAQTAPAARSPDKHVAARAG